MTSPFTVYQLSGRYDAAATTSSLRNGHPINSRSIVRAYIRTKINSDRPALVQEMVLNDSAMSILSTSIRIRAYVELALPVTGDNTVVKTLCRLFN